MDIAIPITENYFSKKSEVKQLKNNVTKDIQDLNLAILKSILVKEKIEFNPQIQDYKELKKSVYKNLSKEEKQKIEDKLKDIQYEINSTLSEMKDLSTPKLKKFFENINSQILSPIARSALVGIMSTVMYNGLMLIPNPIRTIVGVAGTTRAIYKGSKAILKRKREQIGKRYDNLIEKLEVEKDGKGNIIDTRFSAEEIKLIKTYFEKINKNVDISNYEHMRQQIKELNNTEKFSLINSLNNRKVIPIDIENELKGMKKAEKKGILKSIVEGAMVGIAGTSAVNSISPGIIAGIGNFGLINTLTKENSTFQSVVNFLKVESVSILGAEFCKTASKIFSVESLLMGAVAGGSLGLGRFAATTVYTALKGTYAKMKMMKAKKEKRSKDKEIYQEKTFLTEKQKMIVNIIKQYMVQKGINVECDIESKKDLQKYIEQLSIDERKELNQLVGVMGNAANAVQVDNIDKVKSVLNNLENAFLIGATAMTINEFAQFVQNKIENFRRENQNPNTAIETKGSDNSEASVRKTDWKENFNEKRVEEQNINTAVETKGSDNPEARVRKTKADWESKNDGR